MLIDRRGCVGCETCGPVQAIYMREGKADIHRDRCTECGTCARESVVPCPGECFEPEALEWPRTVRRFFSDPMATHEETGIPGRGTEESKTNDVTGRLRRGQLGLALEMGRPHAAARGQDIEVMTTALAAHGVTFEENNPLTHMMADRSQGVLKPELRDVRVISAIIEFAISIDELDDVLKLIEEKAPEVDTVFSLDLAVRFDDEGCIPDLPELDRYGLRPYPNAKINVGLGRPLYRED